MTENALKGKLLLAVRGSLSATLSMQTAALKLTLSPHLL